MIIDAAKIRDFAERYTAAWCSHDASNVAGFFTQNGSLKVNNDAPAVGRKAIANVAQGFMSGFPNLQVLLDKILIKGDNAEYHWTLIGTNTGPQGTGNRVRISGFEVWRFDKDGLIAESKGHFDSADYQQQLEHGAEKI